MCVCGDDMWWRNARVQNELWTCSTASIKHSKRGARGNKNVRLWWFAAVFGLNAWTSGFFLNIIIIILLLLNVFVSFLLLSSRLFAVHVTALWIKCRYYHPAPCSIGCRKPEQQVQSTVDEDQKDGGGPEAHERTLQCLKFGLIRLVIVHTRCGPAGSCANSRTSEVFVCCQLWAMRNFFYQLSTQTHGRLNSLPEPDVFCLRLKNETTLLSLRFSGSRIVEYWLSSPSWVYESPGVQLNNRRSAYTATHCCIMGNRCARESRPSLRSRCFRRSLCANDVLTHQQQRWINKS